MSANILVETKDRIARIEIARTDKKNALTQDMYRAMLTATGLTPQAIVPTLVHCGVLAGLK